MVVTPAGEPVEMVLVPGSTADISALRRMDLNLPEGSTLFGDSGFLDIGLETALREQAGLNLVVPRRSNMKQQLDGCLAFLCGVRRSGWRQLSAS